MKLTLVRHGRPGEDDAERPHDPRLHADGWRQAEAVAALLAREGVTRIVSSPLQRARQTAEPLARRLGMAVDRIDGWAEADRHVACYRSTETLRARSPDEWQRFLRDPVMVGFQPGYASVTRLRARDPRMLGVVSINDRGHHAWPAATQATA
jgi:probable phosphoglycerate mutase